MKRVHKHHTYVNNIRNYFKISRISFFSQSIYQLWKNMMWFLRVNHVPYDKNKSKPIQFSATVPLMYLLKIFFLRLMKKTSLQSPSVKFSVLYSILQYVSFMWNVYMYIWVYMQYSHKEIDNYIFRCFGHLVAYWGGIFSSYLNALL